jgi:hypothetical protein
LFLSKIAPSTTRRRQEQPRPRRRYQLTILFAFDGDRATAQVERVLSYRWYWQAWLRDQVASSIGFADVRIARWCEINDLDRADGATAFAKGELPRFDWPRGKLKGWTRARQDWLDRQRHPLPPHM